MTSFRSPLRSGADGELELLERPMVAGGSLYASGEEGASDDEWQSSEGFTTGVASRDTQYELRDALIDLVRLHDEMDDCSHRVQAAFTALDDPTLTPGDEQLDLYAAWRDSERWIDRQESLATRLDAAQRRLARLEQRAARQDRHARAPVRRACGGARDVVEIVDSEDEVDGVGATVDREVLECVNGRVDGGEEVGEEVGEEEEEEDVCERPACVICREEIETNSVLALECAHVFHADCIELWLQRRSACPICLRQVPRF